MNFYKKYVDNVAKCSICTKTKGKRNCIAFGGAVCSACCGKSRVEDKCEGCSFFKTSHQIRRYNKVPYFGIHEMAENAQLQNAADVIEGAICAFDKTKEQTTKDVLYEKIMERLFDHYYFRDETLLFSDKLEQEGFAFIDKAIKEDLIQASDDLLVKIIGAVYRSIKRHSSGSYSNREYINFIYQHVGVRATTGNRVIPKMGGFVE